MSIDRWGRRVPDNDLAQSVRVFILLCVLAIVVGLALGDHFGAPVLLRLIGAS